MANYHASFWLLKTVTKPFAKMRYRIEVENESIVPNQGAVIICSNHLHKRDQIAVYYSTHRTIHYMAKKEYFIHQPTKTIYKLWGAVPTDRENGKAAMDVCQKLLEDGEAVGIFPEGTRNALKPAEIEQLYHLCPTFSKMSYDNFFALVRKQNPKVSQINLLKSLYEEKRIGKDEYEENVLSPNQFLLSLVENSVITQGDYEDSILLPLKYGAVKLAQKTGAPIITSAGDGNFESGTVRFRYGESFTVEKECTDEQLQEYNKKIRESIIATYKMIIQS